MDQFWRISFLLLKWLNLIAWKFFFFIIFSVGPLFSRWITIFFLLLKLLFLESQKYFRSINDRTLHLLWAFDSLLLLLELDKSKVLSFEYLNWKWLVFIENSPQSFACGLCIEITDFYFRECHWQVYRGLLLVNRCHVFFKFLLASDAAECGMCVDPLAASTSFLSWS